MIESCFPSVSAMCRIPLELASRAPSHCLGCFSGFGTRSRVFANLRPPLDSVLLASSSPSNGNWTWKTDLSLFIVAKFQINTYCRTFARDFAVIVVAYVGWHCHGVGINLGIVSMGFGFAGSVHFAGSRLRQPKSNSFNAVIMASGASFLASNRWRPSADYSATFNSSEIPANVFRIELTAKYISSYACFRFFSTDCGP